VVLKRYPRPSPLPEGEGAEWGIFKKYADLKGPCRIHNRLVFSGRCIAKDASVNPLSLRERARVRGFSGLILNST